VLAAVGVCGCAPRYPGEPVGTFHVVGALVENTCGASAVPAFDPLVFDVEVRADRGQGFWRRPMLPVVSGTYGRDGAFRFSTVSQAKVLDPIEELGLPGCVVTQTEVVSGQLRELSADGGTYADAGDASDLADAGMPDHDASLDDDADAGEIALGLSGDNTVALSPTPGSACAAATATG